MLLLVMLCLAHKLSDRLADDDATVPTSVKLLRTAHMTGQADILRGLLRRLSGAAPDVTSARDWLVCVVSEYTARA